MDRESTLKMIDRELQEMASRREELTDRDLEDLRLLTQLMLRLINERADRDRRERVNG